MWRNFYFSNKEEEMDEENENEEEGMVHDSNVSNIDMYYVL